jgi:drug/metabolite transporter (DMT)-like permease
MLLRSLRAWLIGGAALLCTDACWAQNDNGAAGASAGCMACTGCGSTLIFIAIASFVLSIALLAWVARDAKARGMDSSILWMLLVFFTGLIGFVIYLFARPQGNMIPCPNCGNQRLQASVKCPHCGIGS